MTTKNQDLYKAGKTYIVDDAERFWACIDRIGTKAQNGPLTRAYRDAIKKEAKDAIQNGALLESTGFRKDGTAVFTIPVGEAWKDMLIFTDIRPSDHPLNIGLKIHKKGWNGMGYTVSP